MTVQGVKKVDVDYSAKTATCWVEIDTKPDVVASGLSGRFSGSVEGS